MIKFTKKQITISVVLLVLFLAGLGVGLYFLLRKKTSGLAKLIRVEIKPRGVGLRKKDGTMSPTRIARFRANSSSEWDIDAVDNAQLLKEIESTTKMIVDGKCKDRNLCRARIAGDIVLYAARDALPSGNADAIMAALNRAPPAEIPRQALALMSEEPVPSGILFVL